MISLTCSEKKLFCLDFNFNFILFCGKKFFILEKQTKTKKHEKNHFFSTFENHAGCE